MSKLCKSCGNYYEGDHCDKCGYGDPNLKTHAADKYKKPTKPERFRTEEEKELYAQWEKEKKEDTEIKRHYDPNAGKKTLAIVAVVVIGVIVAVLYKSGVIFSSTKTEVIENSISSVRRWNGQPPFSRITSPDTRKPVPEIAQLVPRSILGKFKKRASRRNHKP
jgi:uncharacterized membrane protein YvbJ